MADVFKEINNEIEKKPEDDRLSKINSILSGIKSQKEEQVKSKQQPSQETIPQEEIQQQVVNEVDKTPIENYNAVNGDNLQEQLDEAIATIEGLEQELTERDEIETELIKERMKNRELEAKFELLSGTAKGYMEKVNAIEYDSTRTQVPTEFMSLIRYYKDSKGEDEYAKESKKLMESEMLRLTEKITGKPLTGYITDLRAFGNQPIEGNFSAMGVPNSKREETKEQKNTMLSNIF